MSCGLSQSFFFSSQQVQLLPPLEYPLVNRLYKSHYKPGKLSGSNSAYVLRHPEKGNIVACVKLNLYPEYWFLSSLLVLPPYRRLGLAGLLLKGALSQLPSHHPVYCFAQPQLAPIYLAQGFTLVADDFLPADLRARIGKYRRKQSLHAFVRPVDNKSH
ncbi:GNAT family N-acetyltransferase [Motilimonas pumila]|uniref:GNAT family N-acetyltransferase n=1 Tax=Motilimonas pumila TaxID=2303987 RepID=A0A418YH17_9GAMM|nr:GNAT family N-acetyltransferase [Motilimonas pumila]RJG49386.1 GNAT family N-acetyltransferase [Motilimonas pumila]